MGDLDRVGDPLHRELAHEGRFGRIVVALDQLGDHRGAGDAGRDGIDPNVGRRLGGQRFGEADDPGLGHRIGGVVRSVRSRPIPDAMLTMLDSSPYAYGAGRARESR